MAITAIGDVSNQVQKYWAPIMMKQMRQNNVLIDVCSKEYMGDLRVGGDSVYVSQINAPTGDLLTVGTDADSFSAEQLSMSRVSITANRRAVAAFEFEDLAVLLSQLESQESEIRDSLMYAVSKQINTYLYSLLVPSTSAPDHAIVTTDFNAANVSGARALAAAAKWSYAEPWYLMVDSSYMSDILDDVTLSSSEYGASDTPMIGGQMSLKRFNFNIVEDNSLDTDIGFALTPSALHLVMAKQPTFQISDLHAQGKFGYKISCDCVFGAALGVDGDERCIKWTAS